MSSAWPSIIKSEARRRGPKKRLSFAPTPEEGETTEVQDENVSQPGSVWVSGDLSCRMTGLGMCYDPKAAHRTRQEPRDSVPMKESHRNNLTSVLHSATPSGTTANVLIVGEKILGEKFKAYLLERHHKRDTIQGLKWRMDLNIKCEKTLTPAMTPTAHYIIFLFMMDTHESMMTLSKVLESYSEDALPGKKIMVITVASAQGCFKNVIDLEQFHSLLDSYQLIHFPWKEQGRLGQMEVARILDLIYKSVGYHKSVSLLMDYIIQLNINWNE